MAAIPCGTRAAGLRPDCGLATAWYGSPWPNSHEGGNAGTAASQSRHAMGRNATRFVGVLIGLTLALCLPPPAAMAADKLPLVGQPRRDHGRRHRQHRPRLSGQRADHPLRGFSQRTLIRRRPVRNGRFAGRRHLVGVRHRPCGWHLHRDRLGRDPAQRQAHQRIGYAVDRGRRRAGIAEAGRSRRWRASPRGGGRASPSR